MTFIYFSKKSIVDAYHDSDCLLKQLKLLILLFQYLTIQSRQLF
jgi:hypothetical protein